MKQIYHVVALSLVIVTSLAYEEEKLKAGIKNGIYRLTYDYEHGLVKNDILEYFPEEMSELAPQVRRYFMGKQDGYSTTKVRKKSSS